MAEKILIVEDEKALQETLTYNLIHEGYEVTVAGDGETAIDRARAIHPDLLLLDIMLPGKDGFEVCRILRQEMNTPILMLTARDDEIDRVVGLEVGADDYMTKPFSMRELMARVKAMLRRVRLIREEVQTVESPSELIKFSNLTIDLKRREANLNNKPLELKPKEYDLLLYFAEHPAAPFLVTLSLSKSGMGFFQVTAAPLMFTCVGCEKRLKKIPQDQNVL
jgi:DNA-binding response OmpR family regulator